MIVHKVDDKGWLTGWGRKLRVAIWGCVPISRVGLGVAAIGEIVEKSIHDSIPGDSIGPGVGTIKRGTSTGGQLGPGVCRKSGNSNIVCVSPPSELSPAVDAWHVGSIGRAKLHVCPV